jgi:N utilization substance protein B
MNNNRSLSRELSLISLGLIKDKGDFKLNKLQVEEIFESALDSLVNHCRDELDNCEVELEKCITKNIRK